MRNKASVKRVKSGRVLRIDMTRCKLMYYILFPLFSPLGSGTHEIDFVPLPF